MTDRQAPRPPHARCHAVIATARRGGARFSITARMDAAVKKAIAASAEDAWTPIRYPHAVWDDEGQCWVSEAEVAEIGFTAFTSRRKTDHITGRLNVRRVKRLNPASVPEGQSELFAAYRHHAVFTDSPQPMLQAETTHRQHAVIEQINADLKAGPLAHLPSGKFAANSAWLVLAAIAFNLTRAAGALASQFHARATTGTIRTQLIAVPTRISRAPPAGCGCTCPATGPGNTPGPSSSTPPADHPQPSDRPPPHQARPETDSGRAGQTGGCAALTPADQDRIMGRRTDQDRRWIEAEPRRPGQAGRASSSVSARSMNSLSAGFWPSPAKCP
nr:hypothetical protein [Modestobacter marinus]